MVGADDPDGIGYRLLARMQWQIVNTSVWRVGIDDARGSACPSHDIGGFISVARC